MRLFARAVAAFVSCALIAGAGLEPPVYAEPSTPWSYLLSKEDTGAHAWTSKHPEADGRGVVIAILDTGIDPGTVGLDRDTEGSPRILAMRDFSGQGRVALSRARIRADRDLAETDAGAVRGFPSGHDRGSADRGRGLWLGFFEEQRIGSSDARDLDGDGDSHDRFAVAVWQDPQTGTRMAAIDTNGDGDLSDEIARRTWEADPTPFIFARRDAARAQAPLNFGLYIAEDAWEVELSFDDGGHGTHCAGIAGGRGIAGKAGFDGVAPGVQFLALKIGDNRLAGGASTDGAMLAAVKFASEWARRHARPVVINLSYGVGARVEGASTIEALIDKELQQNPLLLASVSAGNAGPGLSTVGTPAGADLVWTAGALLPSEQAAALYGASEAPRSRRAPRLGPTVFSFSSRGGELAKPDGLTPGIAWSTAPPFARRNIMAGTSMAAPHAAGVMALLISRAVAEGLSWTPFDIKRSMIAGARPIAGQSHLDQGAGIVDVARSWEHLVRTTKAARPPGMALVAGYKVATPVPHRPGQTGSASFWRIGGQPLREAMNVKFKVTPVFYSTHSDNAINNWFEEHRLESDSAWARPTKARAPIRGPQSTDIAVRVDFGALANKPGLHTALIRAKTAAGLAFVLPIHVLIPETFDGDAPLAVKGELLPGGLARILVAIPSPTAGLEAILSVVGPRELAATLSAFDASGDQQGDAGKPATTDQDHVQTLSLDADDVSDGVWEFVVRAPITNAAAIKWELGLVARQIYAPSAIPLATGADRLGAAKIEIVNRHDLVFRGQLALHLDGWSRTQQLTLRQGSLTQTLEVGPGVAQLNLVVTVPDATWHALTDLALTVRDAKGQEVLATAMSGPPLPITFPTQPGTYTLEIKAARATSEGGPDLKLALTERHELTIPIEFKVPGPLSGDSLTLYPGVRTPLSLKTDAALPFLPAGFTHSGGLELLDTSGAQWLKQRACFTLN